MSYLSVILDKCPLDTEFKVCATLVDIDKAWQCCERFESHTIKTKYGQVHGEWLVRIIPHHDEIDECDQYTGDVLQVAVALSGLACIGFILIGWGLS